MTEEPSSLNLNMSIENVDISNQILSNTDQITSSEKELSESDAENEVRFTKSRTKLKRIAESDSDSDKRNCHEEVNTVTSPYKSDSDDYTDREGFSVKKKSNTEVRRRIRNVSNSESESQPCSEDNVNETNKYDLSRTKLKNKKLQDKFKKLKHPKSLTNENNDQPSTDISDGDTDNSSDGAISCLNIKQKLKKKSSHTLTSICDPDTSDEETNVKTKPLKSKPRSIKLVSPKAVRMSAKQAMENMQKIKSESNRMLREKEVSLPYHRPKALTLKDIMNRRKPAITADGKSLPIKMNNEQLTHYSLMLEQRQKEMMELCKSDTDEEEETCAEQVSINNSDKSRQSKASSGDEKTPNEENYGSADLNDSIFDEINLAHNTKDNKDILNEQNIKEAMVVNEHNFIESDNYNENAKNEIGNMEEQQKKLILAQKDSSPLNDILKATGQTIEKKEQAMEVASFPDDNVLHLNGLNKYTEEESQVISLHYDSEKTETTDIQEKSEVVIGVEGGSCHKVEDNKAIISNDEKNKENVIHESDDFSDNDFTMEELDKIIENAECNKDKINKILPNIETTLEMKPVLTGTPGMVINLDESGETSQKKLTGVELLKERFTYFAKLKSLEEMEKDREKKFKPGIQHLKLKQELEEQIAEQRSLEWEKRLQVENQLKADTSIVEGEEFDGEEIEKIEAKLEENDVADEEEESSSEEELEETDIGNLKDKPRIRNPLVDDEAEVSDDEGDVCNDGDDDVENAEDEDVVNESDDDEETSESEQEAEQPKCRKGRILKAFEDSDDEDSKAEPKLDQALQSENEMRESQDDEIQLAQPQKTYSDELLISQECSQKSVNTTNTPKDADTSLDLGSQTFSILTSGKEHTTTFEKKDISSEKLDVIYETQPCSDENFDAIVGMCTGGFSQNLVTPQAESSQLSQSQLGDDVAALCNGKFYDNPFISQVDTEIGVNNENGIIDESINNSELEKSTEEADKTKGPEDNADLEKSEDFVNPEKPGDIFNLEKPEDIVIPKNPDFLNPKKPEDTAKPTKVHEENKLLKSILDELGDPEFDSPKPNKYFYNDNKTQDNDNSQSVENTQFKKKLVIESDDETNVSAEVTGKKKKRRMRKLETRALLISDDEDDYSDAEQETYESDTEQDNHRLVEYDSEENEVEIQERVPKKKRKGTEFFEQEAELTSEDEWMGSGDEDEAGLDRMEREEGDDDTFHQGKLQRELGEIHMREVLDQDKREVRLLQELLFEDGDLGDGHRQRKFKWKNTDGEEESGTNADEYADTQEDEFESEEQWRKQRHEREMFLRKMQAKDGDEANVTINRSAFIKANLASKTTSSTIEEKKSSPKSVENPPSHEMNEKRTTNNIPSPKKPFIMLKQNYHTSLLTRGRGALARLAALATPLAGDGDDAPRVNASSNRGNFVFAAITPSDTKVIKRKADTAPDTPRLLKKMKQEINKSSKSSLLDHL